MEDKFEKIKELVEELLISAIHDDSKIKELDSSIDPQSHSRTVYLAHTINEFLYGKKK